MAPLSEWREMVVPYCWVGSWGGGQVAYNVLGHSFLAESQSLLLGEGHLMLLTELCSRAQW